MPPTQISTAAAAGCLKRVRLRLAFGLCWALLFGITGVSRPALAETKDPYEMLAADNIGRDLKSGYTLRADTWGGDLPADGSKRIECTLLRGNDYRFYAYSGTKGAKISFHIQDHDGTNVELHGWQKEKGTFCFVGADITPKATGSYFLVVKVEQTSSDRTEWSLVYAYK